MDVASACAKVDKLLEDALSLSNAQDRLQRVCQRIVQTGIVDFACICLIYPTTQAFAVGAIYGCGSASFPTAINSRASLQHSSQLACKQQDVPANSPTSSPEAISPTHRKKRHLCLFSPAESEGSETSSGNDDSGNDDFRQPHKNMFSLSGNGVFMIDGCGWSLEDVVPASAPWFYECMGPHYNQAQPREAAWLHRAGMGSIISLPCTHEGSTSTQGVLIVASESKQWDQQLLSKLAQLAQLVAPVAAEATADATQSHFNCNRPKRFQSFNDLAGCMLEELVNLDKILLKKIQDRAVVEDLSIHLELIGVPAQAKKEEAPMVPSRLFHSSSRQEHVQPAPAPHDAAVSTSQSAQHGPSLPLLSTTVTRLVPPIPAVTSLHAPNGTTDSLLRPVAAVVAVLDPAIQSRLQGSAAYVAATRDGAGLLLGVNSLRHDAASHTHSADPNQQHWSHSGPSGVAHGMTGDVRDGAGGAHIRPVDCVDARQTQSQSPSWGFLLDAPVHHPLAKVSVQEAPGLRAHDELAMALKNTPSTCVPLAVCKAMAAMAAPVVPSASTSVPSVNGRQEKEQPPRTRSDSRPSQQQLKSVRDSHWNMWRQMGSAAPHGPKSILEGSKELLVSQVARNSEAFNVLLSQQSRRSVGEVPWSYASLMTARSSGAGRDRPRSISGCQRGAFPALVSAVTAATGARGSTRRSTQGSTHGSTRGSAESAQQLATACQQPAYLLSGPQLASSSSLFGSSAHSNLFVEGAEEVRSLLGAQACVPRPTHVSSLFCLNETQAWGDSVEKDAVC